MAHKVVMRPEFSPTMSVTEFKRHYWYATELREICRKLGLDCTGTKAELTSRVEHFLSGDVDSSSSEEELRISMTDTTLGLVVSPDTDSYTKLSTKVIGGFSFNANWRAFCSRVLGEPNFKFTKEMSAAVREAKKRHDNSLTVRDLLVIYKTGKQRKAAGEPLPSYMQPEEQTYQWNNFVRTFNADPHSMIFSNKMKVASILWSKVRDSPGSKEYRTDLIDIYAEDLMEYKKVK